MHFWYMKDKPPTERVVIWTGSRAMDEFFTMARFVSMSLTGIE